MGSSIPTLEQTAEVTSWLGSSLAPVDEDHRIRVGQMIPLEYEAYLRVLHPPGDEASDTWATWASQTGNPIRPDSTFAEVSGIDPDSSRNEFIQAMPEPGDMSPDVCEALVSTLVGTSRHAGRLWVAVWDGWLGSSRITPSIPPTRQGMSSHPSGLPSIRILSRTYLLSIQSAAGVCDLSFEGWPVSFSFCWPQDRAWFLGTDIEGMSTYLGASPATVRTVEAASGLETVQVEPSTLIDSW